MTEREKMRRSLLNRAKRIRAELEQIDRDEASYNENHLPPGEEPVTSDHKPQAVAAMAWLDQTIAELEAEEPGQWIGDQWVLDSEREAQ